MSVNQREHSISQMYQVYADFHLFLFFPWLLFFNFDRKFNAAIVIAHIASFLSRLNQNIPAFSRSQPKALRPHDRYSPQRTLT